MKIEEILDLDDSHVETVEVPQWNNCQIRVVSPTATERAELEKRWSNKDAAKNPAGFRADVLAITLKNEDGTAFGTQEQIKKLMGKNAAAVELLFEAGCRVAGLTEKDVEDLEKN